MKINLAQKLAIGGTVLAGGIAGTILMSSAFVHAETALNIDTVIKTSGGITVTSASIGTFVHAQVSVASSTDASTTPTGTVDFSRFSNTSCDGTATVESGVALFDGIASSSAIALPNTGLSFKVHYNGDATSSEAIGSCVSVVATGDSAGISTTLSTTTIEVGNSVHDSATLSNVSSNASGTVAYTVYTNSSCSANAMDAGTKNVSSASVPDSNSLVFNTTGTYYWQAVYSGDSQNSIATSSCVSEVLHVNATSTNDQSNGTVDGTVYNDVNDNGVDDNGDSGLSGWTVRLHSGNSNGSIVQTDTTDSNGFYSFANLVFGTYFVEEVNQSGWNQTTGDKLVTINSNNISKTINFANISATSTNDHHGDNEDDNDNNNNGGHTNHSLKEKFFKFFRFQNHDNGLHLGWFKNGKITGNSQNNDNQGNGNGNGKGKGHNKGNGNNDDQGNDD